MAWSCQSTTRTPPLYAIRVLRNNLAITFSPLRSSSRRLRSSSAPRSPSRVPHPTSHQGRRRQPSAKATSSRPDQPHGESLRPGREGGSPRNGKTPPGKNYPWSCCPQPQDVAIPRSPSQGELTGTWDREAPVTPAGMNASTERLDERMDGTMDKCVRPVEQGKGHVKYPLPQFLPYDK